MTVASLFAAYWPSLAAFGTFGLLHSVGAQEPFKNALARWTGPFFVDLLLAQLPGAVLRRRVRALGKEHRQ